MRVWELVLWQVDVGSGGAAGEWQLQHQNSDSSRGTSSNDFDCEG